MPGPIDVPPHLRKYVVRQNYGEYTVQDQAVWRFVLLQTHARLLRTAHPSYATGFDAVGISVERIPNIDEMNERLERHAFQAVCVDGFIPPRAFQTFQARGFLPIAADIRTSEHLAYTPAPDIIHEAAGHAPFLAHPEYAHYLRRIGAIGAKAFSSAHDRAVYDAIYLLSELKENPATTAAQLARAEAEVARLAANRDSPSEAALVARLYWWTVEYGLLGSPDDYRLYGAGLLSSLGEGHFCHRPEVQKRVLDADCIQTAYDITRPQPQLFVARDFEQLGLVLEDVARTLAHRIGGRVALTRARESGEPACLDLDGGLQLAGVVDALHAEGDELELVVMSGPCAVASGDSVLPDWPRSDGYVLPLGFLDDGTSLSRLDPERTRARCDASQRLSLRLRSGVTISGQWMGSRESADHVGLVLLRDCEIARAGELLVRSSAPYPLLLSERVLRAHADVPSGYHAATAFADMQVPKARAFDDRQREIIGLYERALSALREGFGSAVVPRFEAIHRSLAERYPDEWLLRWNLLESWIKLGEGAALRTALEAELEQLEIRFAYREPIATGLAYLRGLGGARALKQGGSR
ncbi:MAG TPA: aromatic amino acid hydroxylase [Polyangiales bacterium]